MYTDCDFVCLEVFWCVWYFFSTTGGAALIPLSTTYFVLISLSRGYYLMMLYTKGSREVSATYNNTNFSMK